MGSGNSKNGGVKGRKTEAPPVGKKSERMKDDYVKFIEREKLRMQNEFKVKAKDKDNIYNHVAEEVKRVAADEEKKG